MSDRVDRSNDAVPPSAAVAGRGARGLLVTVDVSPGELIDKITILEIKRERFVDPAQLANVERELSSLEAALDKHIEPGPELSRLTRELREINETLWSTEEAIRALDRANDHGEAFVSCVQRIFANNRRRAATKRVINELLGARFSEEKSYGEPLE